MAAEPQVPFPPAAPFPPESRTNSASSAGRACQEEGSLAHYCAQAIQTIEKVLATQPRQRSQLADFGERDLVRLRDCLIDQYRQAQPSAQERLVTALQQVNIALSLITGVEYPETGIHEPLLSEARDILKNLTF